jgi:hypothetical protein
MATINEGVRVIHLHAERKSYRSIVEDTGILINYLLIHNVWNLAGISKTQAQRMIKHRSDTSEVKPSPRRGRF